MNRSTCARRRKRRRNSNRSSPKTNWAVGSMEWHAEQLAARKEREMNHAAHSEALSLAGEPSGGRETEPTAAGQARFRIRLPPAESKKTFGPPTSTGPPTSRRFSGADVVGEFRK